MIRKELAEFRVDVLVTAAYQEFHVFDDLDDGPPRRETLRSRLRSVTVMNTIMSALNDRICKLESLGTPE